MPVAIACDKCGKRYSVNETVLGKRVTCKQCAQPFVAKAGESKSSAAPAVKPVSTTVASPPHAATPKAVAKVSAPAMPSRPARPKVIPMADDQTDWSALEAAASGTEVFEAPPAAPVATARRGTPPGERAASAVAFFSRLSAGTITRMSAVVLALLFSFAALVTPDARMVGIAFFFLGAFAYFVIGLIVLVVRGMRAEGEGSIAPGAVIGLLFSVVFSAIARQPIYLNRGRRSGGIPGGKILGLFGNAVFIFLMMFVVGMLPMIFGEHLAQPAPFAFRQPQPIFPQSPAMPTHNRPVPLSQRFSTDQITTVKITGLTDVSNQGGWLYQHIFNLAESGNAQGKGSDGDSNYAMELVTKLTLDDLAARIDFGTATVDVPTRTITVATDAAKLDTLLAADPAYHPRNENPKAQSAAADSAPPTSTAPQQPIPDNKLPSKKPMPDHVDPGTKVLVHWGASWWPATVVRMEGNRYRIHYDGWDAASDETVGDDRIQPDIHF